MNCKLDANVAYIRISLPYDIEGIFARKDILPLS